MSQAGKIILGVLVCLLAAGCGLKLTVNAIDKANDLGLISGTIIHPDHKEGVPILVLLLSINPDTNKPQAIKAHAILNKPQEYAFYVLPGKYAVTAFEYLNGNPLDLKDEYVGWLPNAIEISKGTRETNVDIVMQRGKKARDIYPDLFDQNTPAFEAKFPDFVSGEIASLDDKMFSDRYGDLGLWNPIDYMAQIRIGIYFTEKYDPNKIPVLFVHGVGGHPGHWKSLAASLDKTRFQPWFVYYPSFFRLDIVNEFMVKNINALRTMYHFDKMYIVAHSMGGLVARGTINRFSTVGDAAFIKGLVTISTPWCGHEMAAAGVANSPVVLPVWLDMVPDSPYLTQLFVQKLPDNIPFALFFGYKTRASLLNSTSSDGTISLRSQLDPRAQEAAYYIRGFDEGHRSILDAESVAAHLNTVLSDMNSK